MATAGPLVTFQTPSHISESLGQCLLALISPSSSIKWIRVDFGCLITECFSLTSCHDYCSRTLLWAIPADKHLREEPGFR